MKDLEKPTDDAQQFVVAHPNWQITPNSECCRIIEALYTQTGNQSEVAKTLNERKIMRPGWCKSRRCDPLWTGAIVSMFYRSHTRKALSSGKPAVFGTRRKTEAKKSAAVKVVKKLKNVVLPQSVPLDNTVKHNAKIFVQRNPQWTIWPMGYLVNWVQQRLDEGFSIRACTKLLKRNKILRGSYRSGNPAISPENLNYLMRRYGPPKTITEKPVRRKRPTSIKASNSEYFDLRSQTWLAPTRIRMDFVFEGDLTDASAVEAINNVLALSKQRGSVVLTQVVK